MPSVTQEGRVTAATHRLRHVRRVAPARRSVLRLHVRDGDLCRPNDLAPGWEHDRVRRRREEREAPLVEASKPVAKRLEPFLSQARAFAADAEPTVRDLSRTVRTPGADNDLVEFLRVL